ncbi:hypothetical protein D9615_002162 [Tricholomella constricta]|uniref:Uncharacterized protein n=1 Tax=Tricholomella constricta TaxID=117010 RepID=A0A8H5HQ59_9AGAR|nr:hypothetical protein D9615_002162 [Tricholomella constricta]
MQLGRKWFPSKTTTARNLCTMEWCKNVGGSTPQFAAYWEGLKDTPEGQIRLNLGHPRSGCDCMAGRRLPLILIAFHPVAAPTWTSLTTPSTGTPDLAHSESRPWHGVPPSITASLYLYVPASGPESSLACSGIQRGNARARSGYLLDFTWEDLGILLSQLNSPRSVLVRSSQHSVTGNWGDDGAGRMEWGERGSLVAWMFAFACRHAPDSGASPSPRTTPYIRTSAHNLASPTSSFRFSLPRRCRQPHPGSRSQSQLAFLLPLPTSSLVSSGPPPLVYCDIALPDQKEVTLSSPRRTCTKHQAPSTNHQSLITTHQVHAELLPAHMLSAPVPKRQKARGSTFVGVHDDVELARFTASFYVYITWEPEKCSDILLGKENPRVKIKSITAISTFFDPPSEPSPSTTYTAHLLTKQALNRPRTPPGPAIARSSGERILTPPPSACRAPPHCSSTAAAAADWFIFSSFLYLEQTNQFGPSEKVHWSHSAASHRIPLEPQASPRSARGTSTGTGTKHRHRHQAPSTKHQAPSTKHHPGER